MATANAETIPTPHTNGVIEDGYEEEDKTKMRPADIDADMREMERRKRVELIMNSRLFREELERIIESQMRDGNNSAGLLQQISDMVGSKYNNHFFRNANCVVPINDIRGLEAMGFVKGEKILRCKLAALFRIIDLYGWSQNIYNHITARLSHQEEHFLVNPYGLLYSEVTASSLAKVDMQGNVIESGSTNFSVSVAGFKLHAAIYAFRPDLKCIIHLHTPSVLAISSLKDGLLPLCQEAAVIGEVSVYSYSGTPTDSEEGDKIARSLGPNNKVIFLTNHGALCCGGTIEETFFNAYNTVSACETQLKVLPLGKDNLLILSDEARKSMYDAARKMPENVKSATSNATSAPIMTEKRWRVGGLEFEALMRMLDNAGFRTGYIYRTPLIRGELPRPRNDVEVPPAVSSLGYLLEEEELYKHGGWRKHMGSKGSDRIRWLNSPNVYQKVEILETGTTDPRKITKWVGPNNEEWVAEGSPSHTSTPVKIENALQFVPKNTNPKEFKKLQQQIKDNRRADKITSGPQSHILEGVSWEEAKKLQDANMSGTSDQVILVGAASKGIIQREYQHNATVYKTPYAKNPFDAVTDEELESYKRDITRKQRGSSYYDEDESDSLPVKGITSETEDDSLAHETRVIKIQTSTAPKESRAEVVLSDDGKKSKSKFMQSLGSMLSLRRELASFFNTVDVLNTSMWEVRKFYPIKRLVTTVRIRTYPTEDEEPPLILRLSTDANDGVRLFDLDSILRAYCNKEENTLTWKSVFKKVSEELTRRFRSGDIFRHDERSSVGNVEEDSKALVMQSFDSSEVEYTTWIEIPSRQSYARSRRSGSPDDFSSIATTEDENEAFSSPGSGDEVKASTSLTSLTSCIGAEYEEWKAPYLELTSAEAQELTTSFRSASDDTSAEDVTVIYCPTLSTGRPEDRVARTDDSSLSSMSSISDDDGDIDEDSRVTYSSFNDVDYIEHMQPVFQSSEDSAMSSKCRETRFATDLSIIYEEERNTDSELITIQSDLAQRVTKISECSESTEEVYSSFPLSGYESGSVNEPDSSGKEDTSADVKLSPGMSEMTWTIDDFSSIEEVDEIIQQTWNEEVPPLNVVNAVTSDRDQTTNEKEEISQEAFVLIEDNSFGGEGSENARNLSDNTTFVENEVSEEDNDEQREDLLSLEAAENFSLDVNNNDQLVVEEAAEIMDGEEKTSGSELIEHGYPVVQIDEDEDIPITENCEESIINEENCNNEVEIRSENSSLLSPDEVVSLDSIDDKCDQFLADIVEEMTRALCEEILCNDSAENLSSVDSGEMSPFDENNNDQFLVEEAAEIMDVEETVVDIRPEKGSQHLDGFMSLGNTDDQFFANEFEETNVEENLFNEVDIVSECSQMQSETSQSHVEAPNMKRNENIGMEDDEVSLQDVADPVEEISRRSDDFNLDISTNEGALERKDDQASGNRSHDVSSVIFTDGQIESKLVVFEKNGRNTGEHEFVSQRFLSVEDISKVSVREEDDECDYFLKNLFEMTYGEDCSSEEFWSAEMEEVAYCDQDFIVQNEIDSEFGSKNYPHVCVCDEPLHVEESCGADGASNVESNLTSPSFREIEAQQERCEYFLRYLFEMTDEEDDCRSEEFDSVEMDEAQQECSSDNTECYLPDNNVSVVDSPTTHSKMDAETEYNEIPSSNLYSVPCKENDEEIIVTNDNANISNSFENEELEDVCSADRVDENIATSNGELSNENEEQHDEIEGSLVENIHPKNEDSNIHSIGFQNDEWIEPSMDECSSVYENDQLTRNAGPSELSALVSLERTIGLSNLLLAHVAHYRQRNMDGSIEIQNVEASGPSIDECGNGQHVRSSSPNESSAPSSLERTIGLSNLLLAHVAQYAERNAHRSIEFQNDQSGEALINDCSIISENNQFVRNFGRSESPVVSNLERTIVLSHLLLAHVSHYAQRNVDTVATDTDSETPSVETIAIRSQLLSSPEDPLSAENTVSDTSLHSCVADAGTRALENSNTSSSSSRAVEDSESENEVFDENVPSELAMTKSRTSLDFDVANDQCLQDSELSHSAPPLENPRTTSSRRDSFDESYSPVEGNFDRDAPQKEVEFAERGVNTSVAINPSVSCQCDDNQNEMPVNDNANANPSQQRTNFESANDFELFLSLHIEWEDKRASLGSPSPSHECDESGCSGRHSPLVNDSVDDSDTASPGARHHYNRSIHILKDFKQNYPKFIQYSDFSPNVKIRRRTLRKCVNTPKRCKRGSVYPGKSRHVRDSSTPTSREAGYRRYSGVSADWPLIADEPSTSTAHQKSDLSNFACNSNCDFVSGITSVKASTPTDENEKRAPVTCPISSPNLTSLEEFELLETLLKTKD